MSATAEYNAEGQAETDTGHATLAEALVAAQADMPAVQADATNPHFGSQFVSLGQLVSKVRPVLNRHGLAFAQFPSENEQGKPTLVTVLIHGASGERLSYSAPLMLPKADPQGQGSAITYMRRYALAAALGIVDQEDDDGNAASGSAKADPIDAGRADALNALIGEALGAGKVDGAGLSTIFTAAGWSGSKIDRAAVATLTPAQADQIEGHLRARMEATA